MIYLVTNNPRLFQSDLFKISTVEEAFSILEPLSIVGLDTETEGLDVYTKQLLLVQLGDFNNQVVIDCTSVDISVFKNYLESDRLFIAWNAKFDLKFLMHHHILPKRIYDGFLAEKLLWMGYPSGMHEMSLKAAGINYLNVELDKTVRGSIIKQGLTDRVIVYAANDVKYLESIRDKQLEKLTDQGLLKAIEVENEFIKPCTYFEYCGAKIDPVKWKTKVDQDKITLEENLSALNTFMENFFLEHNGSIEDYTVTVDFKVKEFTDEGDCIEYTLPSGAIPIGAEKMKEGDTSALYQTIKRSFLWVRMDLQGDLFSGYSSTPKCQVDWNSSKQAVPIMEFFGIDCNTIDPTTKKPKKSVDKKVLKPQSHKSEIVSLFLAYKKTVIQVNTFGDKFLDLLNPVTHRLHCNFNPLGTDTGRLSSTDPNMQNLPSDEITRSCFVAEEGNAWLSADYKGQESFLMASIANDKAMLDELINGSGDMHSLTAKMIFPEIPRDFPVSEIKEAFRQQRRQAKGYEFLWNYGGGVSTLERNFGLPHNEALRLDTAYREGFAGLAAYQEFRRKEVMRLGYILLSPLTGHKAYIYDYAELKKLMEQQSEPGYWTRYKEAKTRNPDAKIVQDVKKLARRRATSEKQSINYPIQAAGALTFKLACIKFYNYLLNNNLLYIVKLTVPVHDRFCCV